MPNVRPVSKSKPWQQISLEVMAKGFKKCCVSDEMDGSEDVKEVGNMGSEHEGGQ
jgi:hypothetical protein